MEIERAVLLQILSEGPEHRWTRAALGHEFPEIEPETLDEALLNLEHMGVIERPGDTVHASRAVERLDELDLIGI
jgi:DNA-binding HxlR family transcriptional regulator